MSRQKKLPSLSRNLSAAITELGKVFGMNSLSTKKRDFIRSIRKDNNILAVLKLDSRRVLIWTKEGGRRMLVFLSPEGGPEDNARFKKWIEEPAASMLRKRGIRLDYASHGDVVEFKWGADGDMKR